MSLYRPAIIALSCLLLSGCSTLPNRTEEATEAINEPATFTSPTYETPEIVDSLLDVFDDEQLNALVQRALENNPDLLTAYAKLEEAEFNFGQTRARLFPSLSANGGFNRRGPNPTNTFSASLDASWEVDLWRGLRNSTAASASDLAATEAIFEATRQSLIAQTMQSWFSLISAGKRLDLATNKRDSFTSTYELVERRYEAGTATITELDLAQTDAASARADYHARFDDRDQAARALQALLGEYPDKALTTNRTWPSLDRSVPAGLPSELLLRRPDIVAAYERILAADARVKVAYVDLFPSLTLTASGGRSSNILSDLADSAFDVWSLVGSLSQPLFKGGQLRDELSAADKRAEQAYQSYRSVVLNAFREVENALSSEAYLEREETARLEALAAARRAEAKTLREYEEGLTDILSLLEAQRRVFSTEEQTINLRVTRLNNRVALALALGKGV